MAGSDTTITTNRKASTGPTRAPARSASRVIRVPLDRLLPEDVVAELRDVARDTADFGAEFLDELINRLQLKKRYGVSRCRLRNYLTRLRRAAPESTGATPEHGTKRGEEPDGWDKKIRPIRRRQASVAAILDGTFGQSASCKPELWERRAYLMLIGLVYERLATNEDEMSTDELVALAKILAENRRVDARLRERPRSHEPADSDETATTPSGDLPRNLTNVVRQVYGTNLETPPTPCDLDGGSRPDAESNPVGCTRSSSPER